MTLDSDKKDFELQEVDDNCSNLSSEDCDLEYEEEDDEHKSSKSKIWKLIFGLVIISTLILAALKNPSKIEAKAEIKNMFLEKLNEEMHEDVSDSESFIVEHLSTSFVNMLANSIYDNWVQTDVSNYVLFSTFDANVKINKKKKTLASGIIIFGKIIPLKSDLKENVRKKFGLMDD